MLAFSTPVRLLHCMFPAGLLLAVAIVAAAAATFVPRAFCLRLVVGRSYSQVPGQLIQGQLLAEMPAFLVLDRRR